MRYNNRKKSSIWLSFWIFFSIAIGVLIGNLFSFFDTDRRVFYGSNKLDAVLAYINESYVDTVNMQELVESAIPDVVSKLDPHSVYIPAEDMEIFGDELKGHFSGIGVQFILQRDTIVVVNTVEGGPSEAAGIMAGDRIVFVNDSLYAGKNINNAKVMHGLKGPKGTTVKLGIKRYSSNDIFDIQVVREDIPVNSVDVSFIVKDKVGYIKVSKFGSPTYSEFISAISKLKSQGCDSFVIDLRQNTGGYMAAAIQMINEFFEKGQLIVYTEGRAFPRQESYANGTGTCKNDQIIVLIDEDSASASEIFAGAIQDHDRGLIVGRRSFGKGLVQDQRTFRDGSALRLTIARYHTPSGRFIQKYYEKGNSAEYNKDLMNRYLRGEYDSQDSIKSENSSIYYTTGGRPVRSEDGIMPDIFIPRDTTGVNSYYIKLHNSGYIYDYAFEYTDRNRSRLSNFSNWKDLSEYLKKQSLVVNLVSFADSKGVRQRPYLIQESGHLLQKQLEAYIIRNIFGDEGYYQTMLSDDKVLKKAVSLIEEKKATPESVRDFGYKEKALSGLTMSGSYFIERNYIYLASKDIA